MRPVKPQHIYQEVINQMARQRKRPVIREDWRYDDNHWRGATSRVQNEIRPKGTHFRQARAADRVAREVLGPRRLERWPDQAFVLAQPGAENRVPRIRAERH